MTGGGVGIRYRRAPEVLFRNVGPEALLALPGRDGFELLSVTAGTAWRALEVPQSLPDLVQTLAEVFTLDRDGIASEVEALLRHLVELGAVEEVNGDGD